jgi:toxin ParE1/3/4
LTLRLHRLAEAEIREAAEWYARRVEGLDRRFLAAVREAFEALETETRRFAALETVAEGTSFRRVLLGEFPYLVVFELFDDEVFVYAVAHASRRPNYWRRRKRESE